LKSPGRGDLGGEKGLFIERKEKRGKEKRCGDQGEKIGGGTKTGQGKREKRTGGGIETGRLKRRKGEKEKNPKVTREEEMRI